MDRGGAHPERDRPEIGVDSFDALYQSAYGPTVRLAMLLVGSRESAEEITQDAFIRLHARFGELDNPAGYLRTAVVNACHDRRRRRRRLEQRLPRLVSPTTDEGSLDEVAARDEMVAALRRLPIRTQSVLVLRYYGGLDQTEIAEVLGIRASTVRGLVSRGLRRLRDDFETKGGDR